MIEKSLAELALNISEKEYRDLPYLSYSILARYEKGGFSAIPHLYDKIESEALTFGSMVDTIITEGMEKFNEKFVVADFNIPTESVKNVVDALLNAVTEDNIEDVSDNDILSICDIVGYQPKWNTKTRVEKIRTFGGEYFNCVRAIGERTVVSNEVYQSVLATVGALKNNLSSAKYLQQTDEKTGLEFLYQQKFVANIEGLDVKSMMDLIIVFHNKKAIMPVDLKTTSVPEYDFQRKFIENRYDIQSRLYYRILEDAIRKDDYFKDFDLLNFRFLVINKNSLTPMVFEDELCSKSGHLDIVFNNGYKKVLRDPVTIGKELKYYLNTDAKVPEGLNVNVPNKIYKRIISSNW